METSKLCNLCLSPGSINCDFCQFDDSSDDQGASFCSPEHLMLHKDADDDSCFPFRVAYNERVGHYLVATRDLSPLDVILREKMGMPTGTLADTIFPTCLSCYSVLLSDKPNNSSIDSLEDNQRVSEFSLCPHCKLPVCKPISNHDGQSKTPCYQNPIHRDFECKLFQNRNINLDITPESVNHPFYKVLIILRMLIIKLESNVNWKRLDRLMDHKEDRKQDKPSWNQSQGLVKYIQKVLGLEDLFNEDDIQKCIGIVCVNAIKSQLTLPPSQHNEARKTEFEYGYYRCVYPTMALFSNCCDCNCRCIHHGDFGIEIRAQKYIKKGEELTIQYQSLFTGSRKRREMFRKVWYFDCECQRCQDPSELGSYLNAFICPNDSGVVLSAEPLNYDAFWKCENFPENCSFGPVSSHVIASLEDQADKEIIEGPVMKKDDLDQNRKETFAEFCERLIEKFTTNGKSSIPYNESSENKNCKDILRFHPNHYLVMKLKSHLISQYGGTVNMYSKFDDKIILRKIGLCDEFIQVFGKIDVGEGIDWWAITMYEKLRAQMILDQRKLESGGMSMTEFIDNVRKSIEVWKQIMTILWIEPEGSYLRKIASQTQQEISKAQDLVLMAQFF